MLPQSFSTFQDADLVSFDSCIMMMKKKRKKKKKHLTLYIHITFSLLHSFQLLLFSFSISYHDRSQYRHACHHFPLRSFPPQPVSFHCIQTNHSAARTEHYNVASPLHGPAITSTHPFILLEDEVEAQEQTLLLLPIFSCSCILHRSLAITL